MVKIKELNLTSFGKFSQKGIKLGDGVNLLYGPNEAGKSTIQKFIEGVLYGFYKRGLKVRQYTEDQEKYAPWDNPANYRGSIVLEKDGRLLKIERVFTKDSDSVKIIDAVTGEDISEEFAYNRILRVIDPAEDLLSVSRTTFVNTLSISQLSCQTDDSLGAEVAEKFIGMLDTADANLSLKKVLSSLEKKSVEIGTPGAKKTTELGKCYAKIDELKAELQESQKARQRFFEIQEKIETLENQQRELTQKRDNLERAIETQKLIKAKETYNTALALREKLTNLDATLKELKDYSQIDIEEASSALQSGAVLNSLKEEKEAIIKQKKELLGKLEHLQNEYEATKIITRDEGLLNDLPRILSLNDTKADLKREIADLSTRLEGIEAQSSGTLSTDIAQLEKDLETYRLLQDKTRSAAGTISLALAGTGGALTLLSIILGAFVHPALFAAAVLGAALLLAGTASRKGGERAKNQKQMNEILAKYSLTQSQGERALESMLNDGRLALIKQEQLNSQKELFATQLAEKQERQKEITGKIEGYISALVGPFAMSVEELAPLVERAKEILSEINSTTLTLENVEKTLAGKTDQETRLWEQIRETLSKFKCQNSKELRAAIASKQRYDQAASDYKAISDRLSDLLKDQSLEDLKQKAEKAPSDAGPPIDIEKAQLELDTTRQSLEQTNTELKVCKNDIKHLEERYRTPGEIAQELEEWDQKRTALEKEKAAYELAIEKLNYVRTNLHREFAPELNKTVSNFIAAATDNKYTRVLIDKSMKITVEDNGRTVDVSNLSNGTKDLLYIALRVGLIDFLQGGKSALPLIFDDSFTQIDDNRLVNLLTALGKVKDRQILIFTCHNREKEILNALGINHTYIPLTQ